MGLFDSVLCRCPSCAERLEFQSKAGTCDLTDYPLDEVPTLMALDLAGHVQACDCGKVWRLSYGYIPDTVVMHLNEVK